jgi:hypothetical protein
LQTKQLSHKYIRKWERFCIHQHEKRKSCTPSYTLKISTGFDYYLIDLKSHVDYIVITFCLLMSVILLIVLQYWILWKSEILATRLSKSWTNHLCWGLAIYSYKKVGLVSSWFFFFSENIVIRSIRLQTSTDKRL